MQDFLYKVQEGTFVFDLIKTKEMAEAALSFLAESSAAGKKILFVGTKKQLKDKVIEVAKETGSFYVTERWLGGTFTNFEQLKRSLTKMDDMRKKLASGDYADFTKKERLLISRDIEKLERMIGGLSGMTQIPDVMFIVDTHKESTAVREAKRLKVATAGIVDSNGDPDVIDYAIPMNDDATAAVSYMLDLVKEAIVSGKGAVKPKAEAKKKEVKEKKTEKKAEKKEKTA